MDTREMGIKLARRLEELHLSRVKFASMLGVSQQRVCQIIGGGAKKLEMWERIADTLDTPLSYFMDEEAESGMITITGDPAGIRQALTNLQGKEKEPSQNGESSDNGILELLNDNELCNQLKVTASERTINMVRDGYPADLIQKSNTPLIEERKVIEAELVRIESAASVPNLDIFKGVNTRAFLRELQAGSSEEQLDFLWQIYSHIELLHNKMIFHYTYNSPALEVDLPRYIKRCGKSLL